MKNRWLSVWLSAANSAAGAAPGLWTAQMRRQRNATMNEVGRSMSKRSLAATKKRAVSKRGKKSGC